MEPSDLNENVLMFVTDEMITQAEEEEIYDLVKQVLKRYDEDRQVKLVSNFQFKEGDKNEG